jgi:hypothetical protein
VIEVRSYRRVFDLERRIYRLDRFRLNPGGLPVRGMVYVLVAIAVVVVLARVPGVGWPLARLPWYLTYIALPVAAAALLAVVRIEGRPFHLAAPALLGVRRVARVGPRTRRRPHWHPPELTVLPNGGDGRMRALRYRGPGLVLVAVDHERAVRHSPILGRLPGRRPRRAELVIRPSNDSEGLGSGEVIAVSERVRLRVVADPRGGSGARRART